MECFQSIQKLSILILLGFLLSQDCPDLDPEDYGDCTTPLGYIWYENDCYFISGCNMNNDEAYFYSSYEECQISCNPIPSIGDINNDSSINIIDVVALVNIILENNLFTETADLNFDNMLNVIDIVNLVDLILSSTEIRNTWQIINEDILTPKCAYCHYEGSFYAETSNLILTNESAYNQLINRNPDNNSASNDNLVILSDSGGLFGLLSSYFWEKININNQSHFYAEHPGYGEIMPLGGPFLTNGELNFIEDWIWNGSPQEGIVADPIILNDQSEYAPPEFEALNPPTMGIQYHIPPFDVYPNTEREFLYYVPPISGEYFINKVEMIMAPGSHHFIAYQFSDNYFSDEPSAYEIRDIHSPYIEELLSPGSPNPEWMLNVMTLQEHIFVTGTQWPSWEYAFPNGVALKVDSDYGLDLNPHYFNYTNNTIQGEVYLNLHTSLPQDVEHVAGIMQLGNNDITLPPNQETILTKTFDTSEILNSINIEPDSNSSELKIFQLFSHAHQLMTRFDIFILHANGEEQLIYTALDYEHPPVLQLDPPLTINNQQSIISKVTYNNTTDEYVHFGLTSKDEMMIIFGLVYFE